MVFSRSLVGLGRLGTFEVKCNAPPIYSAEAGVVRLDNPRLLFLSIAIVPSRVG